MAQFQNMIGHQGTDTVTALLEHTQKPASGAFASIIGLITFGNGPSLHLAPDPGGIWGAITQHIARRCLQRLGKCGIIVRRLGAAPGLGVLLKGFGPHSNFRIQSEGDWK